MFSIWKTWWNWPGSNSACNTHSLSLGLALCNTCNCSWRTLQGPGISNFLWCLLQLRLHFHSFTQWPCKAPLQGLQTLYTMPGLSEAVEKISVTLSLLSLSCLQNQYHMDDTAKIFCSSGWSLSPMNHGCTRFCVQTLGKHSPRQLLLRIGKLPKLDCQSLTSFRINLYHCELEPFLCEVIPSRHLAVCNCCLLTGILATYVEALCLEQTTWVWAYVASVWILAEFW